jgi:hypothetical protein
MEALNGLFWLTGVRGLLTSLHSLAVRHHRLSLYMDVLVIFIMTIEGDITLLRAVLDMFVRASGLHTNVAKCQFTPISCSEDQINTMHALFPCQLMHFPCKYLGIPLSFHKLKKSEL